MGDRGGLAWPERLGTIEAELAAAAARLRSYEQRHAATLGRPEPLSDRAAALAPRTPEGRDGWRADADALDADLAEAEAELRSWLGRAEAWPGEGAAAEEPA